MASFFGSESDSFVDLLNETQGYPCIERRFFESTREIKKKTKKEDAKVKIAVNDTFQELKTSKEDTTKRKSSSLQPSKSVKTALISQKSLSFRDHYPYTARELMNPLNSNKKTQLNEVLKNFVVAKEKETKECNRQITKKVIPHFKDLTPLPSSDQLETSALIFFEQEISNETKNIATISNKDLVFSETHRAKTVLTKIQKSAFLIKELINRLITMQGFILDSLKEVGKTTVWYNQFFSYLSTIVSNYENREEEMNPLKTFLFSFEKQDAKMRKITLKCFKMEEKECIHVLDVIRKWGDFKTIEGLREKVRTIDHKRTLDLLNFSTEDLSRQVHEWFESADSENFLLNMSAKELLDSLTSIQFFVNDKKIAEKEGLAVLLKEIYAFFEKDEISLQACKNQVYCLSELDTILNSLKTDLSKNPIPWVDIQQTLQPFAAIPFFKFKKIFNPEIHLENLSNFLLELAILPFSLLKIGSKKSWQKATDCLECLFTDLFFNPSYQIKSIEEKLISNIQITDDSFSVVQTKNYRICSPASSENPVIYATIAFIWTILPCLEGLKGCLQISDIEFAKDIGESTKQSILKILNNPTIIDYIDNAMKGKPKILSGSL